MRKEYLGDSYDLVKRFFADGLRQIAPLYAHPRFVPSDIRKEYSAVTSIPILDINELPRGHFGILLDPHTGIPLPTDRRTEATGAHAPLPFIVKEHGNLRPEYMICFDQSHYRSHKSNKSQQMEMKRDFLHDYGIESFYYVSHAPFLFMAGNSLRLTDIRERLQALGIPDGKLGSELPPSGRR